MIKFRVEGMTCGGCARGVTNAVRGVDPEAEVAVDLPGKAIAVSSRAPADRLRSAIEEAGYRATVSV